MDARSKVVADELEEGFRSVICSRATGEMLILSSRRERDRFLACNGLRSVEHQETWVVLKAVFYTSWGKRIPALLARFVDSDRYALIAEDFVCAIGGPSELRKVSYQKGGEEREPSSGVFLVPNIVPDGKDCKLAILFVSYLAALLFDRIIDEGALARSVDILTEHSGSESQDAMDNLNGISDLLPMKISETQVGLRREMRQSDLLKFLEGFAFKFRRIHGLFDEHPDRKAAFAPLEGLAHKAPRLGFPPIIGTPREGRVTPEEEWSPLRFADRAILLFVTLVDRTCDVNKRKRQ